MYDASLGKYCDHTVLRAYTKKEVVKKFCEEAKKYGAASVCVNPVHAALVSRELAGTGIKTCTVIGFPLGASTPAVKAYEAADAVKNGADELDMVINVGALRDGDDAFVSDDIAGVVKAAAGRPVKVIIETCYLTDDEKRRASAICQKAGAAFVKTSSGFGTRGASVGDIKLIREVVGDTMQIKASTDINTQEDAKRMIEAGADRLGLSRIVQVVEGDADMPSASAYNKPPAY